MRYIVVYTEGCSPKTKHFNTLKQARSFCVKFNEAHPKVEYGDDWIDAIIRGKVVDVYEGFFFKDSNNG